MSFVLQDNYRGARTHARCTSLRNIVPQGVLLETPDGATKTNVWRIMCTKAETNLARLWAFLEIIYCNANNSACKILLTNLFSHHIKDLKNKEALIKKNTTCDKTVEEVFPINLLRFLNEIKTKVLLCVLCKMCLCLM